MDRNNFINRVSAILSDKLDGDTVMLIDSLLPDVLKTVCRAVAATKPVGHEKLLGNVVVKTFSNPTHYPQYCVFDYPLMLVETDKFHSVYIQTGDSAFWGESGIDSRNSYNVNSLRGLVLTTEHDQSYYFTEHPVVYLAIPTGFSLSQASITHYLYATIGQFPDELADLLIQEMLRMLQFETAKQSAEGDAP